MVIDATKKHREVFAYGLLGVAALYLISALSLLFKSGSDLGGAGFADKASLFGHVFTHSILVISLFAAVALVTGFGENSRNARTVVLAALGLGAVALVFGLICWLAAFGAESNGLSVFNGVVGAGKVVAVFLGLAQLMFLGLVTFFAFTAFQTFPKPVRAQHQQWGQQPGWGQPAGYDQAHSPPQQGWAQQPAGYDQAPPAGWRQQAGWGQEQGPPHAGYDQAQAAQPQGWVQPAGQPQPGYDQAQQSWGQQPGQQGQPAGWGQSSPTAGSWGEQAQSAPGGDGPQGQPASSWEQLSTPVTEGESTSGDETQVWSSTAESAPGLASEPAEQWDARGDDDLDQGDSRSGADAGDPDEDAPPPQQGWWQQPGS